MFKDADEKDVDDGCGGDDDDGFNHSIGHLQIMPLAWTKSCH